MNIEPLEVRIAPATLVNPTTLTYTDIDGDKVTVTASAGASFVFTNPPNGTAFTDTFLFTPPNAIGGQQLQLIDLRQGTGFQGADLTISVVPAGGGDGLAAIGLIFAPGIDLGVVSVKGDLGEIDCGDIDTNTPGLEMLSVRSMGRYGDVTDALIPGLRSDIAGALGTLRVTADIKDAQIVVTADVNADAKIGSITIGGSLIGGAAGGSGSIIASGDVGPVKIGGDMIGGDGNFSGRFSILGGLASLSIGGSLVGGSGFTAGSLRVEGSVGPVKIRGNLQGGSGDNAGFFDAGKLGAVTLGGSLLGGAGESSGRILSDGDIGSVKIAHDVKGGAGNESGKIDAGGKITGIAIGGSLLGGSGDQNTLARPGQIFAAGDIGAIKIGHDVTGGSGDESAKIDAGGNLAALTIGGSLVGGSGLRAGSIFIDGRIGPIRIGHDIAGGTGGGSAQITADAGLVSVTVGGSLIGNVGNGSARIATDGDIGPVKIGHDVIGGAGQFSGIIETGSIGGIGGRMAGVTIDGSLIGGSALATGGVSSEGDMAFVKIGHDLIGGSITGTMPTLQGSGFIESDRRIGSVFIGGSIIAGIDNSTVGRLAFGATINAEDDIGSVTVKGGLIGNVTPNGQSFVIINAIGQATPAATSDVAIGKISIGGRAEFAQIFAGYDDSSPPFGVNADAQIGSVTVGGDWIASSIVAGAVNLGADDAPGGTAADADNIRFGDSHDFKITGGTDNANRFSKIGRISIAGQVFGTPLSFSDTDLFGFVAEEIGALKIGGATFTLEPGRNNDGRIFTQTRDLRLHEIDAAFPVAPLPTTPALLVNASTVTYDDFDGDHVTVSFSKPLLTAGNVNTVFRFESEIVGGPNSRQGLQLIDLRSLAAAGLSVTITVAPGGGDRLANVGAIVADEDLGTITVPGDLGQIAAGDANGATQALAALKVRTLGRLGLDTQPAAFATFVPFVGGDIIGSLGALTVKQDIAGASLAITGGLGALTIGGSLIGESAAAGGTIFTAQSIGAVKIGHHVQAGINGSGFIDAGTSIASVSVGGSLLGGVINADGTTLGTIKIGHNVMGGLTDFTGRFAGNTGVGSVTVGGSFLGGLGTSSGQIFSGVSIGAVRVGHNVVGGAGDESGKVDAGGKLASVTIRGSLIGGGGDYNTISSGGIFHRAQIFAIGDIGRLTIAHDVMGGAGAASGGIRSAGNLAGLSVGGSVVGGTESDSARISVTGSIGPVKIGHDLAGGPGQNSASITAGDALTSATIGGSLIGGAAIGTGAIFVSHTLAPVKIGHDVLGGSGPGSGAITATLADGDLAGVTIGGSLFGGSNGSTGAISSAGAIAFVKIGRDLIGGSIAGTTATLDRSGFILAQKRIGSVSIGGSVIAGIDDSTNGALTTNASIRAGQDLGALSVKGSLIGNTGDGTAPNLSRVIITASGQPTLAANATLDLAIKSISVGGRVERAQILAGYSPTLGVDGPGSIGPVTVGGDWVASDLVAGADEDDDPTAPNLFGDFDDVPITAPGTALIARIASVTIKGVVVGSAAPGNDHFGFVSHVIGSFKSLNFTAPLTNSVIRDVIELSPITGDATIREV